jgi:Microsomal signal peptidase 12 kDa subunit (SPC12)
LDNNEIQQTNAREQFTKQQDDKKISSLSIMDYKGQQLSELIFYWIIIAFGGVGWIIGYFRQEFFIVFKFWLVGVVLSMIVSHL